LRFEDDMNERIRYAFTTSLAALILLGIVFYQYSATHLVYAHTFSGNESAAFIATVGVIRAELRLINSTVASNASLANEHANIAAEHLSKNDTSELAERNQRIATDLPKDLSDLQNMTAKVSPSNMSGIIAVSQKVSDTDALLGEALTTRIEPVQLRNATTYGWAVADLLNETLERYGETLGMSENSSGSSDTIAAPSSNESNNTASNIVSYADYQSTIGLVNMTKEMLNQVNSLARGSTNSSANSSQGNSSNAGTTTMNDTTANSNAAANIDSELDQLRSLIDNKSNYEQVATFVYNTIYPDLNSAFGLGLEKVDATQAIEEARSGEEG
jgi:hypothetical protein